ncbi:MAG: M48 family metallopeptidase [Acidimicrobiales bacterium]|nr:M48 family metallopeptidase [Acidimicrobiales bacterium]
MTNLLPADRIRFPNISSAAWEHSTDRAALHSLQSIPGFDTVIRKVIGAIGERNIKLIFTAQALEVGPVQYSDLYELLVEVCETLDHPVPRLYVSQTPLANAGAVGVDNPFIVLNSSLIELSSLDQIRFVLGHEVGHIISEHSLYRTLLFILLQFSGSVLPVIGQAVTPITLALLEWNRKAEISSDRAGLLASQDLDMVVSALGVMAGGIRGSEDQISVAALRDQAAEYSDTSGLDTFFKFMATAGRTHPFPVIRVNEIDRFAAGEDYSSALAGNYVQRGDEPPLRDDVAAAGAGFSDSAQTVFTQADEYVNDALTNFAAALRRRARGG